MNDKKCIGIVYLILNHRNYKKYVGITTIKLERRWACHKSDMKTSDYPLYRAMRKYGVDNFSIKPITSITSSNKLELLEKLSILEKKYIKECDSFIQNKGYNLTEGGDISNITEESRKKQSDTMKKKYLDNPLLSKILGKKISDAYKNDQKLGEKISKIQKNRYKKKSERINTGKSIKLAYELNPQLRVNASISHKKLNKLRPELGRLHSIRICGKNHPMFDSNEYEFRNELTKENFIGTRYDFYKKYNLNKDKVTLLIHGERNHHKNWKLIKS